MPCVYRNGLSSGEADLRLKRDGPNVVQEVKGVSIWGILLRQVSNSLTIVSGREIPMCNSGQKH